MDNKELHNILFSAIKHDNVSLLEDLLKADNGRGLLDLPGDDGNMLLHSAVLWNKLECVKCLLSNGANPNVFDTNRSRTPLHLAIELDHTEIVKIFLELEHINLDLLDDRNLTCYEIAQFCDNNILADLIQQRQEEINQLKDDFYSVINQACSNNQPRLVLELIGAQEKRIIEKLNKSSLSLKDKHYYAKSRIKELINWSSSSWNDVTLLFKSASMGFTEVCKILIESGATAKCNQNTNYSPLYVAAYGGYTNTVKLLLDNFPSLVSEITIERWTVLHACCLQGHSHTAKLILSYPYPEKLKKPYLKCSDAYEYQFAFDLNAQDAAGQTVIFLAVSANNEELLDTLLQFNVDAMIVESTNQQRTIDPAQSNSNQLDRTKVASIIPDKPKILERNDVPNNNDSQINKIIRQLRKLDANPQNCYEREGKVSVDKNRYLVCPFDLDTYCDYNSKTALHLAVCRSYHKIATTLLVNGSNPNLPILTRNTSISDHSFGSDSQEKLYPDQTASMSWLPVHRSTCLKEACLSNDEVMCEILIRYGAKDQDNLALEVASVNKNVTLMAKFLALNSNIDPEYKINKKCNVEYLSRYKQSQVTCKQAFGDLTTFNSLFPSCPVMIDWHNLKCIKQLDPQWLIEAGLCHNKKLKHPTISLIAITRLDLSSNNLKSIHPVIFRLPSLRELNLSKNRIESLTDFAHRGSTDSNFSTPTMKLIESHRVAMRRSKSASLSPINLETSNMIDLNEPQHWDLPHLEILHLHDNLLITVPDCLFELPKLRELDLSSNQIRQLPSSMWNATSLRELIASGNLLDDLPRVYTGKPSDDYDNLTDCSSQGSFGQSKGKHSTGNDHTSPPRSPDHSTDSTTMNRLNKSFLLDLDDYSEHQFTSNNLKLNYLNHWERNIDLVSNIVGDFPDETDTLHPASKDGRNISKLLSLNLSHNSFSRIPPILACVAANLIRLNMSHNRLTSVEAMCLYPARLKTLDLSNNQITTWSRGLTPDEKSCYTTRECKSPTTMFRNDDLGCIHKIHHRLDQLKSLNISHNLLDEIQLCETNPSSRRKSSSTQITQETGSRCLQKDGHLFPNITALDISYNKVKQVPSQISELRDLSVLNISGNVNISTLPPKLGLASKLWNLGLAGCNLGEPLKSIVESKTYKTMDIVGYLRSILEESKPYARMKLMLVGLQGIGKTSLLELMRQEGTSGLRRKIPEHWTKRMGHVSRANLKNQRGVTLSTVGVDIHDWTYCKRTPKNQPNFGPVTFSTWDFGGQEEFYATHRYFLSKRSIYLVVWNLTSGIEGINSIQQWLVNIQSRASGSPVIIVGTHEDLVAGGEGGQLVKELQDEVHKRFIDLSDHDKCGLPKVMDSFVVSSKNRHNIKYLCDRIYDIVFALRCPGSHERLLEQKIPATYLYLEEIVNWMAQDRHNKKKAPVVTYNEYKKLAADQLKIRHNKIFRDLEPLESRDINHNSELQQATRFLHENGVLLHYEDANLRDLYFLDPQWLCDILSHVVTIREINPHVKNGLMKIDDLGYLFRSIDVDLGGGIQTYVVNLLNKFEVALTWNSQYLLIPSLLPPNIDSLSHQHQVKVAPRARGRSAIRRYEIGTTGMRSASIGPRDKLQTESNFNPGKTSIQLEHQPLKTMRRLVLLRYLPAGFLARLQSSILSDVLFEDICSDIKTTLVDKAQENPSLIDSIGCRAGWTCWKKGIKLILQQESTINSGIKENELVTPLLTIEEVGADLLDQRSNPRKIMVECKTATDRPDVEVFSSRWCNLDTNQYTSIIVISVSSWRVKILNDNKVQQYIEPNHQHIAQLMSTSVEHIDNLLEDWYPSLGARFAHTLGGSYLVSRIAPCMNCFNTLMSLHNESTDISSRQSSRTSRASERRSNFCIAPYSDNIALKTTLNSNQGNIIFSYYVESCILTAYNSQLNCEDTMKRVNPISIQNISEYNRPITNCLRCPKHGSLSLTNFAPDIIFEDIPEEFRIDHKHIERCKLIGRGTFGFVFKGLLRNLDKLQPQRDRDVALKLLQPNDPGPDADHSDLIAYKMIKSNWEREPFECVCKSYCTARHEVNILQTIRHPNVVCFIGICLNPLAIILELAPMGSLTDIFKSYKKSGMRIDQNSCQKTVLQIAKALEFIHQQRIIYRDLKSENILVWDFPSPFATRPQEANVDLKLADYGISRQAHSTGIWKGFAGTISFLAPEILRYNGDEEYTEKVDCFSFGVFMYELLTLRQLLKQNEAIRGFLADCARPTLILKDLIYPNHMLDLMSLCWSQEPHLRPTSSQIVSIASAPEFMQLYDVAMLDSTSNVSFSYAIHYPSSRGSSVDLWLGRESFKTEVLTSDSNRWSEYQQLTDTDIDQDNFKATCMCVIDNRIWICDSNMMVHVIPLGSRLGSNLKISSELDQMNDIIRLNRVQTFHLDQTGAISDVVDQMVEVKSARCAVMRLRSGRLWIIKLDAMELEHIDDVSIKFSCMTVIENASSETKEDQTKFLIVCGQSNGISCLEIHNYCINRQCILPLTDQSLDQAGEKILDPSQSTEVTCIAACGDLTWTSAGCTVHLWNLKNKCIIRKLDCWRLVPCSESLESINIESYYEEARSSVVSSMVYLNESLFVGTSHGCFMVIEGSSLKPVIVFRPYEGHMTLLAPLVVHEQDKSSRDYDDPPYLITIGTGYRDLIKRYVSSLDNSDSTKAKSQTSILWSANFHAV